MKRRHSVEEIHAAAKSLGCSSVACSVGELKKLLAKIPDDTPLVCTGPDIGGYDVGLQGYVYISDDDNIIDGEKAINFSTLEYKAYEHNRGVCLSLLYPLYDSLA